MFNKRRRSYRKGPPANQIYVPHDQRQLNPDPIPIMSEKQAQYYYKQLKDMGYIPPPIIPEDPDFQVFQIGTGDDTYGINFRILNDQSIQWYGNLPSNLSVLDMNNQPIDPKYADQINNKLAMNGYKLYAGKLLYTPALYNDNSDAALPIVGFYNNVDNTNLYTYTLQANHSTTWNYISTAIVSKCSNDILYMIDCDPGVDVYNHVGSVRIGGAVAGSHFSVKAMEIIAVKTT